MEKNKENLSPILKWAGGKRQLLGEIQNLLPDHITTYVEPFLGGGAVLFDLQPKKAIVNDYNSELMNVYNVIRDEPKKLIDLLRKHDMFNSKEYFYQMRSLDRKLNYNNLSNVEKAARVIYLNKTCYNGLFRVNRLGQFNTPYGNYKNPKIVDEKKIMNISEYFNTHNVKIMTGDYKKSLKGLRKGSFVYFDPPYMPLSSISFTGYTELGFSIVEQKELRDICLKLNKQGVKFMISNSDAPEIWRLYGDSSVFNIKVVGANRKINSNIQKRGEISELLITNY